MRMPRCTYGTATSGVPLAPAVPTAAASATVVPSATEIDPRCVSVTAKPSAVVIVTVSPDPGTNPANVTTPAAGARTVSPGSAATSIPRCCPPAYGFAGSNENGCTTAP